MQQRHNVMQQRHNVMQQRHNVMQQRHNVMQLCTSAHFFFIFFHKLTLECQLIDVHSLMLTYRVNKMEVIGAKMFLTFGGRSPANKSSAEK